MKKYEYKVLKSYDPTLVREELSKHAKEGFRVIAMAAAQNFDRALFCWTLEREVTQ